MKFKIITAADQDYFKFAKVLVKSATINFPQASIYTELVNMDKDAKQVIDGLGMQCEAHLKKVNFQNITQKKCFCTNRRVELFSKLRGECDDILIWIDADSIIRKSCDELMKIIANHDISAVVRPKGTIRGGIIAVNNTQAANNFLKTYVKIMEKENQWNKVREVKRLESDRFVWRVWMSNQNVLNNLCIRNKEMKQKINFAALDNKYCDVHLKDEGIIWAAKNKLKKSPIYLEELKKYD